MVDAKFSMFYYPGEPKNAIEKIYKDYVNSIIENGHCPNLHNCIVSGQCNDCNSKDEFCPFAAANFVRGHLKNTTSFADDACFIIFPSTQGYANSFLTLVFNQLFPGRVYNHMFDGLTLNHYGLETNGEVRLSRRDVIANYELKEDDIETLKKYKSAVIVDCVMVSGGILKGTSDCIKKYNSDIDFDYFVISKVRQD